MHSVSPPLTIGGVENFSKYEQKGGIGKFSFSGGDKSLKGGVDFSGGDWDIVTQQIFDKLLMHKIRKKKYFFLIKVKKCFILQNISTC